MSASYYQRLKAARAQGTHTRDAWDLLVNEFGGRCVRCLEIPNRLEPDHIIPIYMKGSDAITNIQPLCGRCNCSKGAETINWVEVRREQFADPDGVQ